MVWLLYTNRKLPLWVPDDQVSIVARGEAALLLIQAAQLSRFLAQESGDIRQREASLMGGAPEQRQTCRGLKSR